MWVWNGKRLPSVQEYMYMYVRCISIWCGRALTESVQQVSLYLPTTDASPRSTDDLQRAFRPYKMAGFIRLMEVTAHAIQEAFPWHFAR